MRFRTIQVYFQKQNFHIPFLFFNTKYVYYIILCLIWKLFLPICLIDRAIGLKGKIYRAIYKTFRKVNVWNFLVWQLNSMIVSGRLQIYLVSFYIFVLFIFFSHGQVSVSTERAAEKEDYADASGESKVFRIKKKDRTCRKPALRAKKEPANSNHKYFSATAFSDIKMM